MSALQSTPPPALENLLGRVLAPEDRDALLGDLAEEHLIRSAVTGREPRTAGTAEKPSLP